jgi:hypothetical protein
MHKTATANMTYCCEAKTIHAHSLATELVARATDEGVRDAVATLNMPNSDNSGTFRAFASTPAVIGDILAKYMPQDSILRLAATCRWVRYCLTDSVCLKATNRIVEAFSANAAHRLRAKGASSLGRRRGTGWANHFAAFFVYCEPWKISHISV